MKIRLANPYLEAPHVWGQPLFVDGSGRPVFQGRGADGTDDDGEGEGDSGADDDADGDGDGDGEGDKDGKGAKLSPADEAALRQKIKLADKRAAAAEARAKELEDKDKSALEVAERKLTEAQELNTKLTAQVRTQALENAFLKVNEVTWHDPDDALTAATRLKLLEGVQDDDGEVDMTKLKTALQKLAKAKPHYVKSNADEEQEQRNNGSGPTGTSTGSGRRKPNSNAPDEKALRERYNAIRR
jgi:hypothetical protein